MTTKRIKKRGWPFAKFAAACKARAARLKIKINVAGLQAAYDASHSIPYAVESLTTKSATKKKTTRRNVEATATPA